MAWTITCGDCVAVLATLEPDSVDAVVTDPPYELGFMGKAWDESGVAFRPDTWRAVRRVLKPGGHLLAFSGTRTSHRMVCAIEDAGFEIRDSLCWMYGSGFPKSLNISKAIDKAAGAEREVTGHKVYAGGHVQNSSDDKLSPPIGTFIRTQDRRETSSAATTEAADWEGWGTALKPAYEPIVLARKPLAGTVAANVLKHGTGALNIDACRIETDGRPLREVAPYRSGVDYHGNSLSGRLDGTLQSSRAIGDTDEGRWPANVILDEEAAALLDDQSGELKTTWVSPDHVNNRSGEFLCSMGHPGAQGFNDSGGASRFFYVAKPDRAERDLGCAHLKLKTGGELTDRQDGSAGLNNPRAGAGRTSGGRNIHPTVKPIALMQWLCRLVTPRGGLVLDPFTGSGTTGIAAIREGMQFYGIELNSEYVEIAKARIIGDAPMFNQAAESTDEPSKALDSQVSLFDI